MIFLGRQRLEAFSRLAITPIGAAVRYAITLDEPEAKRVLAQFKAMLPDRPVREKTTKRRGTQAR